LPLEVSSSLVFAVVADRRRATRAVLVGERSLVITAPRWDVPAAVGLPCPAGQYVDYEDWKQLSNLARAQGWP
jgi:hypothetical protein